MVHPSLLCLFFAHLAHIGTTSCVLLAGLRSGWTERRRVQGRINGTWCHFGPFLSHGTLVHLGCLRAFFVAYSLPFLLLSASSLLRLLGTSALSLVMSSGALHLSRIVIWADVYDSQTELRVQSRILPTFPLMWLCHQQTVLTCSFTLDVLLALHTFFLLFFSSCFLFTVDYRLEPP
ncbi:hypothetical protein BDZ97DRAFT_1825132 [Flammula alnicola]|nr:hypothetical protein BDZ97DRAFT_1825132 [Flammula alnicola]